MKLKYYLRGMGIGIIVTTIILAISFSHREVEISDEEIMARAAALGMVMQQEDKEPDATEAQEVMDAEPDAEAETEPVTDADTNTNVDTENEINTEQEADMESEGQDEEVAAVNSVDNGTYRLVIQRGDVCRVVCETLAENGVIDDAESLRAYLFELGYANSLSIGVYDIPYGLTMEEVAQIIMAGPLE